MLKLRLSSVQRLELESFRKQASSKDSEKALMILLSNDGNSVPAIASLLKRNNHTVRLWLKRYMDKGVKGLRRNFSPGRPGGVRQKAQKRIQDIIGTSPTEHGYQDNAWSVPLITFEVNKSLKMNISAKTVTRALINMGYVYKRPSKTVPKDAPSREEKQESVKAMVQEILTIIDQKESVIYALDESHFSTEPYLVRGWFKKRWPLSHPLTQKKGNTHLLWMLEHQNTKVLLEKIDETGK